MRLDREQLAVVSVTQMRQVLLVEVVLLALLPILSDDPSSHALPNNPIADSLESYEALVFGNVEIPNSWGFFVPVESGHLLDIEIDWLVAGDVLEFRLEVSDQVCAYLLLLVWVLGFGVPVRRSTIETLMWADGIAWNAYVPSYSG